jgi:hypothetical protein
MKALVFFLSVTTVFGAVDGTVQNRTSGKPQAGAMVILLKIGQAGPEMVASTKSDAEGKFSFLQRAEGGPHLLEVAYQGVTYNSMLPPGTPSTGLEVSVYDSSSKPVSARLSQHIVLLEPSPEQLAVSETFFFTNDGNVTWHDPANGTLRFPVPAAAKATLRVNARAPQGMPVERAAVPASQPDVYMLNFAIKPGETRIDVTYSMPITAPGSFAGRLFAKGVPTRLAVPSGVTLSGDGLKSLGQDPNTQAAIYEVSEASYKVDIQGTGSLRAAGSQDAGDDSGPTISQILPRIYDRLSLILIPAFLVLALGFILLYRRGEQRG